MENKKILIVGTPTGFHNPLINKVYLDAHANPKESNVDRWNNPVENIQEILKEVAENINKPRRKHIITQHELFKAYKDAPIPELLPKSFYKFSFEENETNI